MGNTPSTESVSAHSYTVLNDDTVMEALVRPPRTPSRKSNNDTVKVFEDNPSPENTSPRRSSRIKKTPSITPNRFNKFFHPRLKDAKKTSVRPSRKALHNVSASRFNNRLRAPQFSSAVEDLEGPPPKKRRLSFSSVPSIPSSPIRPTDPLSSSDAKTVVAGQATSREAVDSSNTGFETDDDGEEDDSDTDGEEEILNRPRVARYRDISSSAGNLSKQLGRRDVTRYGNDTNLWQHEAANFYSLPGDIFNNPAHSIRRRALPFCSASFNQQESVAMANEDGQIEIFRAWPRMPDYDHSLRFECSLYPHDNAIMDMEFSPDDQFLATASGDQTCRVIDMNTRTGTHTLVGHVGSVKNVRWQPQSGNTLLATCSRDGSVCAWDLRCAQKVLGSTKAKPLTRSPHFLNNSREVTPAREILAAHTPHDKTKLVNGKRTVVPLSSKADFAVTACTWLSESRPHLLATASEHNAIIKIWDMRASFNQRASRPTPVSATVEPRNHELNRPFGITSMVMGTDGSRLYTLCRDNTIYAYSTAHLVLGGTPEMSTTSTKPFKASVGASTGLGPLYGFRHEKLRLGSFYDKLTIRRRTDENTEMLATGTGEDCAVLFPTDERYLTKRARRPFSFTDILAPRSNNVPPRPLIQRTSSAVNPFRSNATPAEDGHTTIYHHGTALLNGHKKEVTCCAWIAGNGQLVTVADDYTARCWYEDDPEKAKSLRNGKERSAERMKSGWAGVMKGWDEDEV